MRSLLLAFALTLTPSLSSPQVAGPTDVREIAVPGRAARARLWSEPDPQGRVVPHYALSLDGESFAPARATDYELRLRLGRFDPRTSRLAIPAGLAAVSGSQVWIVQYWTQGIEAYRATLRRMGVEIHRFLAQHASVVTMDDATRAAVEALPFVRAVVPFHPAYKLEEELLLGLDQGRADTLAVDLLTLRRGGQAPIERWVESHRGRVLHVSRETYLMTVELPWSDLTELARLDDVQWIDRHFEPSSDMNKARNLHGANYVQNTLGLTGQGVRVEVMDAGCDTSHPDLPNFLVHNGNSPDSHGTCTSGIVVGTGMNNSNARGGAPDAFLVVADYGFSYAGGSRYAHTGQLQNPALPYRCVLQSNSWGSGLTTSYTSTSSDMDLILFDHDRISICQSQSNNGDQLSRPQAWAKNIISVGGVIHRDTLSMNDDFWGGGASIGPAADGRIKPDLASFYDSILCTDVVGTGGYSNGNYTPGFGGTSGATPIVAGHLAIVYQLWSEGVFGNPTPGADPFENRPFNTTAKALLINGADSWNFSGTGDDLTRTHQGWGHPDLTDLLNSSANLLVVDEGDVLTELASTTWTVDVPSGVPSLRATMVYRDPPGTTSSSLHRVNDLDLTVQSPSGTVYRGNVGLDIGRFSTPGGVPNTVDTVENVFVELPEAGAWLVTVTASEVNQDAHVETPGTDVDYALVVTGGEGRATSLPAAPSDLVGSTVDLHTARLAFVDHATNESGFVLERSNDGVSFAPVATLPRYQHTYDDLGLDAGASYWYRVHAVNFVGASADSNVVRVSTQKFAPAQRP